jgi:transcriptional regulator with XRE-family HTH domain
MTNERARDIDEEAMQSCRMALRSAFAAAISQFIREKGLTKTEVSGIVDLSRNTVQNVVTAGMDGSVPGPRLDTIADIVYALNVPLGSFLARVEAELLARYPKLAGDTTAYEFEYILGGHVLKGQLRCPERPKNAQ